MANINPKANKAADTFYYRMLNTGHVTHPLKIRKPKQAKGNSLTHGQVERNRKLRKKANFSANVRYRKARTV